MSEPVRQLTEALIARASVTPEDAGCLELIAERLKPLGFSFERIDRNGTSNLWARRGTTAPLMVLAGHTDVVPTGNLDAWTTPPFQPSERDGKLYGRGGADDGYAAYAAIAAIQALKAQGGTHPRIVTQARMQLPMPHIQTHHLRSALLQQAIGEAAGALPHIEASQTLD